MGARKFMKVVDFSEIHDININLIQVMKHNGTIPMNNFDKRGKHQFIDTNYFYRRKDFRQSVWHKAHDNYFTLLEKYTEAQIARLVVKETNNKRKVASWQTYLNNGLFQILSDKVTHTKVSEMLWEFYRATSHIIRREAREAREKESRHVPEFRMLGFDSVDDMYDSFEADRIKEELLTA